MVILGKTYVLGILGERANELVLLGQRWEMDWIY